MNLYELTANAAYLQQLLEDGEIDEQTFNDSLEAMGVDEKIENICKVIRNLEAQAAAFKEEKQRLEKRQSVAENGVKRLKASLVTYMETMLSKKVNAGLFTVSLGSSKSVEVVNEKEIPAIYLVEQPPKIDKTAIGKELKAGEEVPGVVLKESSYVTIR